MSDQSDERDPIAAEVAREVGERQSSDIETQWAAFLAHRDEASLGVSRLHAAGARRVAGRGRWPVLEIGTLVVAIICGFCLILATAHSHVSPVRRYMAAPGQRLTVSLSDGTQMTLGPASTLEVPLDFRAGDRTVTLRGEAYFTVVRDPQHPFTVRAGGVTTRDVGTAFDVRAYADDPTVRVVVAEGVVAVHTEREQGERLLRALDVAEMTGGHLVVTHRADGATLTAWSSGTLVFDQAPLPAVLAELSRWYGVSIVSDSSLAAHRVTLRLANPTLTDALNDLADAMSARVDRRNGTVVLTSLPVGVRR